MANGSTVKKKGRAGRGAEEMTNKVTRSLQRLEALLQQQQALLGTQRSTLNKALPVLRKTVDLLPDRHPTRSTVILMIGTIEATLKLSDHAPSQHDL